MGREATRWRLTGVPPATGDAAARLVWIAETVSMSFMYWYQAQGGSLPVATRPSAQCRHSSKHLSIRLSMPGRFKFRANHE